jgi:CRISPR/Cas system-associated exonuclease Cas4 (RecB family)
MSVTTLLKCPRQLWIQQRCDYSVEIEPLVKAAIGTTFHRDLQSVEEPGWENELRLEVELPVGKKMVRLTGIADAVAVDPKPGDVALRDYKVTWGKPPTKPREDHLWQVSTYLWMAFGEDHEYLAEIVYLPVGKRFTVVPFHPLQVQRRLAKRAAQLLGDSVPSVLPKKEQIKCQWCPVAKHCVELALVHDEEPPSLERKL